MYGTCSVDKFLLNDYCKVNWMKVNGCDNKVLEMYNMHTIQQYLIRRIIRLGYTVQWAQVANGI